MLPSSSSHTQERLAAAQQELQQLEQQQAGIGRRAAWRRRGFIWGGFAAQAGLLGLLFRLVYWDLSWDVMVSEPGYQDPCAVRFGQCCRWSPAGSCQLRIHTHMYTHMHCH